MENPVIDLTLDDNAVEVPLTNTLAPAPIAIGGGSKKKSATNDTCDICAEKFNKTTRVKIDCTFCQFVACKTCCQTYILNSTQPCCMSPECAKPWPRKFINEHFSQVFVNKTLKKHRENVLFDQERALLPATQPLVEREIRKEAIVAEISELRNQQMAIQRQINALRRELWAGGVAPAAAERATFVRACPDGECRGFLSSQWKCGICAKWACPDCHVVKGMERDCEHVCNPDDVATATLLANDTKPCPSCGTGIFKIEGCDQMWCTGCNTAFSWRTGRIESNIIHNPHYFEWVRRTGGNADRPLNEVRCGHEITHHTVRDIRAILVASSVEGARSVMNTLETTCRHLIHNRQVELPRYEYNYVQNNQDLRIQYMRNQISEEKFKLVLQRNQKRHEKNREVGLVLQMLCNSATDILLRFIQEIQQREWKGCRKTLDELKLIVNYANECFLEIATTYNCMAIRVMANLELAATAR
jgi:hypothetical protein